MKWDRIALVLITISLLVVPLAWSQGGNAEQQIKDVTNQVVAAQLKGDAAAYGELLADDYTAVRGGKLATKAQEVEDIRSGVLKYEKSEILDIKVQAYGNAAVATSRNSFKGTVNGKPVNAETLVTRVWVKQHGKWKAVAMHSTRVQQ
jgi:ketosteroid isomerase-like protein